MTRWKPNGRERLEGAALELFAERGFDRTTVAEIAARAGLTERTFFRHYADKREVLFAGAAVLEEALVRPVADSPRSLTPIDAVAKGLRAVADLFEDRREFARQRAEIISASAELRERELIKLATLSAALADTLRRRGVADPAASLTAEIAIAVFRTAFERWVADDNQQDMAELIRESLDQLKALTAGDQAGESPELQVQAR
jgi:AcrR family transcriptional regulator